MLSVMKSISATLKSFYFPIKNQDEYLACKIIRRDFVYFLQNIWRLTTRQRNKVDNSGLGKGGPRIDSTLQ